MTKRLNPDHPQFADHPEFEPDFSPGAMLAAGVFDGGYFFKGTPEDLNGIEPEILVAGPHLKQPDVNLNFFGIHSGMPLKVWKAKGWIHAQDPVGWFQFYCRFYSGRRSEDDERQIKRWIDYKNRWVPKTPGATKRQAITSRGRQALLQWAIDPSSVD